MATPAKSGVAEAQDAAGPLTADVGPLDRMIGYALRRAQMAVFDDFFATLAELNLRPAQFSVLVVLEQSPGSTQSAVGAALGIQRANFVALFDGLEARGLARRSPGRHDKRAHALYLTEAGVTVLARAKRLVADHEARQIARLGPEKTETLLGLLAAFNPKA